MKTINLLLKNCVLMLFVMYPTITKALLDEVHNNGIDVGLSCTPSIFPVAISPTNIDKITRFIESQEIDGEFLSDIYETEKVTAEQLLVNGDGVDNEDVHLNITQLIKKYGRDVEEHEVETEDGYLLTMFRIPGKGSPVFVMHGLLSSADDWVTAGPESAMAYILGNKGYDVWLGNARGNVHSRKHVSRNPDCADFWDFSWDEIGRYDLPAMIDYTLNVTGHSKLFYIGHSQGTTSFFVMCSELPEYNSKISAMVALAPVAYMSHLKSPLLRLLSPAVGLVNLALQAIGMYEFSPKKSFSAALYSYFCGSDLLDTNICPNVINFLIGYDHGQLNITNFPVIFNHFPAGSATKQLAHYGQEIESDKFCRFDHGISTNKEKYGSASPPDYPLEKITAPVYLFYTNEDWFSNDTDVIRLSKRLPNMTLHFINKYNHADFLWANNVAELVNQPILKLLKLFK